MNEDFDFISRHPALRTNLTTGHFGLSAHSAARSTSGSVVAFFDGKDPIPCVLEREELESCGRAVSQRMLPSRTSPQTVRDLLDRMAALSEAHSLPDRDMFLVAEGARTSQENQSFPLNALLASTLRMEFRDGNLRKLTEFEAKMARLDPAASPHRMRQDGTIEEVTVG